MRQYYDLLARIGRLPIPLESLGLATELKHLHDSVVKWKSFDLEMYQIVDARVRHIEQQLMTSCFLEPDRSAGLGAGDVEFIRTAGGQPVRTSVLSHRPNVELHYLLAGKPASGKSCGAGYFSSQLAEAGYPTLIIDPTRSFRSMECMRNHHFVRFDDLRINPFEVYDGVLPALTFEYMARLLAECYPLIYAEYLIITALQELHEQGKANLPDLIALLQRKQTTAHRGSKSPAWAESGEMVLQNLANATRGVFDCSKGMNLEDMLLNNNIVLEVSSTPKHQAYFCRLIFQVITLLATAGRKPPKGLTIFLDEGQTTAAATGEEFVAVMTTIRHSGINVVVNYQNIVKAPVQLLGCVDVVVIFRSTDKRDVDTFANCANLTRDQAQRIPLLNEAECICSMSRSPWKAAFLAQVPTLSFRDVSDEQIEQESKAFLKQFCWEPCDSFAGVDGISTTLPEEAKRFMRDVLDQDRYEFSPVTHRYERAKLRSTDVQRRVRDLLEAEGLIEIHTLAVNPGRPYTLIQPSAKAFALFGVQWKRTRGTLPTRAATQYLLQKLETLRKQKKLKTVKREGVLGEGDDVKQVDLLCSGPDGNIWTFEISGSADHECHNALHCLAHGSTKHYVVCTTKDIESEVKKRFEAHDELRHNEKVFVTVLTQVMKDEWIP